MVKVPKLCRQREQGRPDRAYVRIEGRKIICGRWGSQEARARHAELIARWEAGGLSAAAPSSSITVGQLTHAYLDHCKAYYPNPGGGISKEAYHVDLVGRSLRRMYGSTPVRDFGPKKLKVYRQHLIAQRYSRTYVNDQVSRVRRMFKWGVEEELVGVTILQALQAVSGLRKGKSAAKESEPVRPVTRERVDAVLPFLSRQVVAMIELQWLTGMRSGELVIMRACDIDMSGPVWIYTPSKHKNDHRGQGRTVPIGPQGQEVIRPFLQRDVSAYLFSPIDATKERYAACETHRRQPVKPAATDRKVRDRYDSASYGRAIERACRQAFGDRHYELRWHPHQLRHAYATRVRQHAGLEAAQAGLGHASMDATQVYAERVDRLAVELAQRIG